MTNNLETMEQDVLSKLEFRIKSLPDDLRAELLRRLGASQGGCGGGLAREIRDAAYKMRETYSRHLYQDEVEAIIRRHIA